MKTTFLSLLAFSILLLYSCSDGPDSMMEDEPDDDIITAAEYANLARPCLEAEQAITLPPSLLLENNYLSNEYTIEIHYIVTLSEQFRTSLGHLFLPPSDVYRATVDDVSIFADDTAYEWSVGGERYVFRKTDDGYQLLYYASDAAASRELVRMIQDEDCSKMDYTQYTVLADQGKTLGDVEFKYDYEQAGSAKIVYFGTCINDPNTSEFNVRVEEDQSGEIRVTDGGELSRVLLWKADGSGSYELWEDGQQVDSGTWTL